MCTCIQAFPYFFQLYIYWRKIAKIAFRPKGKILHCQCIKGRFYANLSVLYLMALFYARNVGVYSHVCDILYYAHNGKILCQQCLISRVLLPPLLFYVHIIKGTFYADNLVGVKSSFYSYIHSQANCFKLH